MQWADKMAARYRHGVAWRSGHRQTSDGAVADLQLPHMLTLHSHLQSLCPVIRAVSHTSPFDVGTASSRKRVRKISQPQGKALAIETAQLYREKLEQRGRDMGVYDVLEKALPSVQAIFMEALSAMEARQIKR